MKAALRAVLLLDMAREDRLRTGGAFLLFALFMASYYVFKTSRDSLFLHYESAKKLPYAYLGSVGVALVAMLVYNQVLKALGGRRLLSVTVVLLTGSALIFWPAWSSQPAGAPSPFLVYAFFFWVTLFGVMASTLFWSVANDIFGSGVGRKIYGYIGAGGIAGGFLGSAATQQLVAHHILQTEGLLPLGAGVGLLTIPLMLWLFRHSPSMGPVTPRQPGVSRDGLVTIFRDPYVAAMALLVFTMTFVGTMFDIQYKNIVELAILDKEAKTAFFGGLYAGISAAGFAIQVLVTGPVHRRWEPIAGLVVLPVVGVAAAAVLLAHPSLGAIRVVWILAGASLYSINQSSKEQLYIPTSETVKYGSKGFIDVFVFRLGDGAGSAVVLLATAVLGLPIGSVLVLCMASLPLWAGILLYLRKAYRRRIEEFQSGASAA